MKFQSRQTKFQTFNRTSEWYMYMPTSSSREKTSSPADCIWKPRMSSVPFLGEKWARELRFRRGRNNEGSSLSNVVWKVGSQLILAQSVGQIKIVRRFFFHQKFFDVIHHSCCLQPFPQKKKQKSSYGRASRTPGAKNLDFSSSRCFVKNKEESGWKDLNHFSPLHPTSWRD